MSKFIDNAKKYIGVREGTNNFTNLVKYYNQNCISHVPSNRKYQMKLTDEWCAMFCSVIAHQTGIKNFPYEVSVFYMWQRAKQMGLATTKPKVNYLVIYDWKNDGTLNHVGIVNQIIGDKINVIEGNYDRCVKYRTISVNSNQIHGYIRVDVPSNTSIPSTNSTIHQLALDVIRGKYGSGETRKKMLGSSYNAVQKRVNEILSK